MKKKEFQHQQGPPRVRSKENKIEITEKGHAVTKIGRKMSMKRENRRIWAQ